MPVHFSGRQTFANQEGQREADFIAIVVWGKIAELCGNSLTKGQRALVDGRLQIRSYDAKDGTKRWVTEVIANSVEFIERKSNWQRSSGSVRRCRSEERDGIFWFRSSF